MVFFVLVGGWCVMYVILILVRFGKVVLGDNWLCWVGIGYY